MKQTTIFHHLQQVLTLLISLWLVACGSSSHQGNVELRGEIKGLESDTIYLYGIDQFYHHVDTIPVKNGKFRQWLQADTLAETRLTFGDGVDYPLYLSPGDRITIQGDSSRRKRLQVAGNVENQLLTHFYAEADSLKSEAERQQLALTTICNNPQNLAVIELLNRYFVQISHPHMERIDSLITLLDSELKDRPQVDRLRNLIEENKKRQVGRVAPYFTVKGTDGQRIARSDYRDCYMLLHFWASWDQPSRAMGREWQALYNELKKAKRVAKKNDQTSKQFSGKSNLANQEKKEKQLALIGISIDGHLEEWRQAIKADSLNFIQGNDRDVWSAQTLELYNIHTLPSNIFINRKGTIIGRNVTPQTVADSLGLKR